MNTEKKLEKLGKMLDALRRGGSNAFKDYLEKNNFGLRDFVQMDRKPEPRADGPFMKFVKTGEYEKGKIRFNRD